MSAVGVEFTAQWVSVASRLNATGMAAHTGQLAVAAARAQTPWTVAFDGDDLCLTVGPVPLSGAAMQQALATLHQLHTTTGQALAHEAAGCDSRGVRLRVPGPLASGVCEPLRQVMATPLIQMLGPDALSRFTVRLDAGAVVLRLEESLLPEVADHLLPLLAGVGAVVALEAPDGVLPSRGVGQLLESAAAQLSGTLSRRALDLIGGATDDAVAATARDVLDAQTIGDAPADEFGPLRIIPARPDGHPVDEAERPGSGCSDAIGLIDRSQSDDEDTLWILFHLDEPDDQPADGAEIDVCLSAWFMPDRESPLPAPVPGLTKVAVPATRIAAAHPRPSLAPARFEAGSTHAYVASIAPRRDLLPGAGSGWAWDDADRCCAP